MVTVTQTETKADITLSNLLETTRSQATRHQYHKGLDYFMGYIGLGREYDKLIERNPKDIQQLICSWIIGLKKTKSSATISTYLAGVKKFLIMNDIEGINWYRVHNYEPEKIRTHADREYSREEIQTLLEKADYRNRAIIYLMSSAGLRVGALPSLKLRHLIPIDKYNIYKVIVYEGTKSQYYSFTTPECRAAVEKYFSFRERCREILTEDSPLFRGEINYRRTVRGNNQQINCKVKPIFIDSINQAIIAVQKQTGVNVTGKVHLTHGFRKYFMTTAIKAGMSPLYAKILMGHSLGIVDSAYIKINETDILEGNDKLVGYTGIIDALTIDESQRLRHENQGLKIRSDKVDKIMQEFDEVKKRLGIP